MWNKAIKVMLHRVGGLTWVRVSVDYHVKYFLSCCSSRAQIFPIKSRPSSSVQFFVICFPFVPLACTWTLLFIFSQFSFYFIVYSYIFCPCPNSLPLKCIMWLPHKYIATKRYLNGLNQHKKRENQTIWGKLAEEFSFRELCKTKFEILILSSQKNESENIHLQMISMLWSSSSEAYM